MYDYERLVDGTILTTSAVSVYTNASGTAWIKEIILHNYGSVAATVTLYDGVAGDATQFFCQELAAKATKTIEFRVGIKKTGTEVLQAKCDIATACNIRASGGAE